MLLDDNSDVVLGNVTAERLRSLVIASVVAELHQDKRRTEHASLAGPAVEDDKAAERFNLLGSDIVLEKQSDVWKATPGGTKRKIVIAAKFSNYMHSPQPAMPIVVGEPICDVSVTVNVKLKMRGFLAVKEGDVVTLIEAQNVEPGMVMCRAGGETGKVPRSAVLLTKHTWNAYLEVLPWLLRHLAFLEQLLQNGVSAADLVLMLAAKNLLREALALLFQRELAEKSVRHLENETFRQESPAMLVAAALLSMPAVCEFRSSLVAIAVSALARCGGDAEALLHVLGVIFAQLERMADTAPPELVILMQSLRTV